MFLRALAGGLGLGATTALARGQAPSSIASERRRAREDGLPLLLIVVPDDPDDRSALARLWVDLFRLGSDAELADLCLVRLAAVSKDELRAASPTTPRDATLALYEPWGLTPRSLRPKELPRVCLLGEEGNDDLLRRNAALSAAVARLVQPDAKALQRHRERVERAARHFRRSEPHADRALAYGWRVEAESHQGEERLRRLAWVTILLGDELRERPLTRGPAKSCGLGGRLACAGGPCGTGYFPEPTRRFVDFFTAG